MPASTNHAPRRRRAMLMAVAGLAGGAVAAAATVATASTFTLKAERNVHVTNAPTKAFRVKPVNANEAVAVGPAGYAVYTFQGETTHHIICKKTSNASTNCWAFWPPVSVSSARGVSKAAGIAGKLGTFRNHGLLQLTLNGQPLYYFTPDLESGNKREATGDELKTYGSIWHIVLAHVSGGTTRSGAGGMGMTTTTTSPTTSPYPGY